MNGRVILVGLLLSFLHPPAPQAHAPRMHISLVPYVGVIPATMANGRPVYKFSVLLIDPESKKGTSSHVILQAVMERHLKHRADARAWLGGRVRIEESGAASYEVEYINDGRVLATSSAVVDVRPR